MIDKVSVRSELIIDANEIIPLFLFFEIITERMEKIEAIVYDSVRTSSHSLSEFLIANVVLFN